MNGKEFKSLVKTIPNDSEVKIMIPDRNNVPEVQELKITVGETVTTIEAE